MFSSVNFFPKEGVAGSGSVGGDPVECAAEETEKSAENDGSETGDAENHEKLTEFFAPRTMDKVVE